MRSIQFAVIGLLMLCVVPAVGQQDRMTPALALARICVSEAGWTCFETGDALMIHEVLLRGSERRGISYVSFARSYASRVMGARPHDHPRLSWVMNLTPSGAQPQNWPETVVVRRNGQVTTQPHAPWSRYRADWLAVYSQAQDTIATSNFENIDVWSICAEPVFDWGGWMDRERAARMGLVRVDCGQTRNDPYTRPSLRGPSPDVDIE